MKVEPTSATAKLKASMKKQEEMNQVYAAQAEQTKAVANTHDLRAQFAAAALSGLIARGAGQSADAIINSALNYADAMMEKFK